MSVDDGLHAAAGEVFKAFHGAGAAAVLLHFLCKALCRAAAGGDHHGSRVGYDLLCILVGKNADGLNAHSTGREEVAVGDYEVVALSNTPSKTELLGMLGLANTERDSR